MYRIETVEGELVEFQQSKEGPDYNVLVQGSTCKSVIRYKPSDIIHLRVNMYGGALPVDFYPYGYGVMETLSQGEWHSKAWFCYQVKHSAEDVVWR